MLSFRSAAPTVTLAKSFVTPFDNAVATARTCYSSRVITDDDVRNNLPLRDKIAQSTYRAGHHTTLQHAHFEFILDGVSRQALWAFFHAHPFYNSEQVSQRYVEVKAGRVVRPDFGDAAQNDRYDHAVERQMATYHRLNELLEPVVARLYFGLFPARNRTPVDKRWQSAIGKRCQEVSRYVLPIGTHAHLYHTISGLTLHRYHRAALVPECPAEVKGIVDAMVAGVLALDPDFGALLEPSLAASDTADGRLLSRLRGELGPDATRAFAREFDAKLAGRTARLVAMTDAPAAVLGDAVREVFGLPQSALSDDAALTLLLDPQQNPSLGESLNLQSLGKASRALDLVQFTFQKKLSHTADSQDQRHRMTPGARPVLWAQLRPGEPDYILPVIFDEPDAKAARACFVDEMDRVFEDVAFLAAGGAAPEAWQYLLPNAVPVRFTETGSLLDQHHKWTTRLCYNAQEEIWRASLDEVEQVNARAPDVGRWLLPPCALRKRAGVQPYCPEGDRFCGQPVWTKERTSYLRVL